MMAAKQAAASKAASRDETAAAGTSAAAEPTAAELLRPRRPERPDLPDLESFHEAIGLKQKAPLPNAVRPEKARRKFTSYAGAQSAADQEMTTPRSRKMVGGRAAESHIGPILQVDAAPSPRQRPGNPSSNYPGLDSDRGPDRGPPVGTTAGMAFGGYR